MTALRIALIGFGKIARDQHLPALATLPGLTLAAVASPGADSPCLPCFDSLSALLGSGVGFDAVAICTPPQVRGAQAAMALSAGKHVLLEKPPAATLSELAALTTQAQQRGLTLFTSWHARFAAGVASAKAFLAGHRPTAVSIDWREDVRVWHPGQDWIFEPGGLGVFDPGINALSILTEILPHPVLLRAAELQVPLNRAAPIAAELALTDRAGLPIRASFDFLHSGPQLWDISIETEAGLLELGSGGATLRHEGQSLVDAPDGEYRALYQHFAALVASGQSEVDPAPLNLVADAFLLGRQRSVEAFAW